MLLLINETLIVKHTNLVLQMNKNYLSIAGVSLGTIKASQVVVLNEDMQLLLNKYSYKKRDPNPQLNLTSLLL